MNLLIGIISLAPRRKQEGRGRAFAARQNQKRGNPAWTPPVYQAEIIVLVLHADFPVSMALASKAACNAMVCRRLMSER